VESPKEDSNLVLIALESPSQSQDSLSLIEETTSDTQSETASSLINSDLNTFGTEPDSAQSSSTEVSPSLPSRAFSWDENVLEDESLMTVTWPSLPSKPFSSDENHPYDESDSYDKTSIRLVFPQSSSSRNDASDSVRQGKLPARPQSNIFPLQRGQKVIHRPSTSSSGTPNKRERSHYLIPHRASFKRLQTSYFRDPGPSTSQFYDYSFQDVVEQDPLLLEQIARMEEEDRLLAEELQCIEDEDSCLAQKWQTEEMENEKSRKEAEERLTEELFYMEAQEEALRLEQLARIAFDDALLAAAMAQQEQDEYEPGQRELERLAEEERIRQEELERERQLQAERNSIGAPVSVRRVSNWGGISDGDLNEITPEAVKQLKEVKELFSKSLPAFNVKKIEWIINPKLEDQFENTRRMLQNDGRPTTEVILFHGTAPGNVNSY
jgi:hypothetical protein